MRFGRRRRRGLEKLTLNLTTMIDVTFLLLIYFMITTVLDQPEDKLSPTLQTDRQSEAGPASDFQPQIVEVVATQDGGMAYKLGTRLISDASLAAAEGLPPTAYASVKTRLLEALEPLPKEAGVFIKVHEGVPVGFAVAAIQVARDAGFDQVTYVPIE